MIRYGSSSAKAGVSREDTFLISVDQSCSKGGRTKKELETSRHLVVGAHGGEGQGGPCTWRGPGGDTMDVLLAITSIHGKSPCHRVAPVRTGDMSRPSA